MTIRRIRFVKSDWAPITGDSDSLDFAYEMQDIQPYPLDAIPPFKGTVSVNISRTLQSIWNLDQDSLQKVLGVYAKEHLASKVEENSSTGSELLELSTYNAPNEPPFDPATLHFLIPSEFEVEIPEMKDPITKGAAEQASQIIDLRDAVNAVYGERHGKRLLSLAQERALFELSRRCDTREEFSHRVLSLCGLVISIDSGALPTLSGITVDGGSIDKLGQFLRTTYPGSTSDEIMEDFMHFNHLRRMYPTHTDKSSGVLAAFQHFGIEYPLQDYQRAWESLLERYRVLLTRLLHLLRTV
ncbi:hypothetical protein MUP77_15375 [Candidatus Bathyarchaeota archaeon]|nr:hypothetical protein [Candidatus Bathyarchaeota archaeon]